MVVNFRNYKTKVMKRQDEMTVEESRRLVELFVENVWLFIVNTERILEDCRMANVVVPVANGVYFGMGEGAKLTSVKLGVYLKWWRDCPQSHDLFGRPVWRIAGYPFRGFSRSASVSEDGKSINNCSVKGSIKEVWWSFKRIADEYAEITVENPYTIDEAVEILTNEENLKNPYIRLLLIRLNRVETEVQGLREGLTRITDELAKSRREQIKLIVEINRDAISDFMIEYDGKLKEYRRYLSWYYNERKLLKIQRKQGYLSSEDYTCIFTSMRERRQSMKAELELFKQRFIDNIDGGRRLSMSIDEIREAFPS